MDGKTGDSKEDLMPKHLPEAPIANRSEKGPGGHHEIASDATHKKHPRRTKHFRAGRHGQYQAEHDEQRLLPRKTNEIAISRDR